jgi:hypothetical protein
VVKKVVKRKDDLETRYFEDEFGIRLGLLPGRAGEIELATP